jgi:hypothetical protein
MGYYDDNFGWYDMDDDPEGTEEFYHDVQERSVWTTCRRCGRRVKLLPHYNLCNSCAEDIEHGREY